MLIKQIIMTLIFGGLTIGRAGPDNHKIPTESERIIQTAGGPKDGKMETRLGK
jgi:hypothetical protein